MPYLLEPVSDHHDYLLISQLIYETDPFIYRDLFGTLENAEKILPLLLEDNKSIFYKKNYYVVTGNDDEIMGLGKFFKYASAWDEQAIINTFYQLNLPIPQSLKSVSSYFERTFNHPSVGGNACNITVVPKHHRQGVGDFIIKQFIILAGNQDIHLTVLADNLPAIKLYEKNGFIIVDTFLDYGGHNGPPVLCHEMRYFLQRK